MSKDRYLDMGKLSDLRKLTPGEEDKTVCFIYNFFPWLEEPWLLDGQRSDNDIFDNIEEWRAYKIKELIADGFSATPAVLRYCDWNEKIGAEKRQEHQRKLHEEWKEREARRKAEREAEHEKYKADHNNDLKLCSKFGCIIRKDECPTCRYYNSELRCCGR